ncbi:hypothetical protein Mapa_000808 [Marchantia paleacea]|nr:hypothetical protein Mapa_000808 [Marchantia paleacea]
MLESFSVYSGIRFLFENNSHIFDLPASHAVQLASQNSSLAAVAGAAAVGAVADEVEVRFAQESTGENPTRSFATSYKT